MNSLNQQTIAATALRITLGIMFLAHSIVLKYLISRGEEVSIGTGLLVKPLL